MKLQDLKDFRTSDPSGLFYLDSAQAWDIIESYLGTENPDNYNLG